MAKTDNTITPEVPTTFYVEGRRFSIATSEQRVPSHPKKFTLESLSTHWKNIALGILFFAVVYLLVLVIASNAKVSIMEERMESQDKKIDAFIQMKFHSTGRHLTKWEYIEGTDPAFYIEKIDKDAVEKENEKTEKAKMIQRVTELEKQLESEKNEKVNMTQRLSILEAELEKEKEEKRKETEDTGNLNTAKFDSVHSYLMKLSQDTLEKIEALNVSVTELEIEIFRNLIQSKEVLNAEQQEEIEYILPTHASTVNSKSVVHQKKAKKNVFTKFETGANKYFFLRKNFKSLIKGSLFGILPLMGMFTGVPALAAVSSAAAYYKSGGAAAIGAISAYSIVSYIFETYTIEEIKAAFNHYYQDPSLILVDLYHEANKTYYSFIETTKSVIDSIPSSMEELQEALSTAGSAVVSTATSAYDTVANGAGVAANAVANGAGVAANAVVSGLASAKNGVSALFSFPFIL